MLEANLCHCKKCGELKTRIEDGKYPNSKNKRYVDGSKKLWSGKVCPECQKNRTKENMKNMRFNRALVTSDENKD